MQNGRYPVCIYTKGTALNPFLQGLQEAGGEETARAAAASSEGAPRIVIDPFCEVYPGDDAAVARHPGVDLVVGQHEGAHLDGVESVRVVAEEPGHGVAPNFLELLQGEAAGPASVLIPEPVTLPHVVELAPDDAGEGGAQQGARGGVLGDAGAEQL